MTEHEQDKGSFVYDLIQYIADNRTNSKGFSTDDLPTLYNKADQIIQQFDSSINRCKKYNETKVYRKYQIIIKDLQAEVRKLNQKLSLEQEARTPSKKHISEVLDKLVSYKDENQIMKKQLQQAYSLIRQLQQKLGMQKGVTMGKIDAQHLPPINNSPFNNLEDAIKCFQKNKKRQRGILTSPSNLSHLQKFLQNKEIYMNCNFVDILHQIDNWVENKLSQRTNKVDMLRIRSNIAHKFSQYLDDSNSLVKKSETLNHQYRSNKIVPLSPQKIQGIKKNFKNQHQSIRSSGIKRILDHSFS